MRGGTQAKSLAGHKSKYNILCYSKDEMEYQRLRGYIRLTAEAVELCEQCEGEGSIRLPARQIDSGARQRPVVVGLTNDPERLIQLRRNRLDLLQHNETTEYTDIEAVRAEVRDARRVFVQMRWPVIDVTRRSIEETASSIMTLLARRHGVND